MAAVRAAFKSREDSSPLDDVLIFEGLKPDELVQIVDIQLEQLASGSRSVAWSFRCRCRQAVGWRPRVRPVTAARPLRRLVQQAIGDQLAKLLLAG